MSVKKVLNGGYCIGCGACTGGTNSAVGKMALNHRGQFEVVTDDPGKLNSEVCPFSDDALNEDEISGHFNGGEGVSKDSRFGAYTSLHAGYVAENGFRSRGSSGGFTSWMLHELLEQRLVDAVVHVKPRSPTNDDARLFEFGVSRTADELCHGAKSHYYPVEMSGVLAHIRETPGRYAVVGVPCFIKAVRLLMLREAVFADRVKYCVGLFCGHLKGTGFAEFLAWQCGVVPGQIEQVDFRVKLPGRPASRYGFGASRRVDGSRLDFVRPADELVGTDWGMGFFKYKACDFCDDVSAEVADVSVGDAWLPEYVSDSRGANVVIVRNQELEQLIGNAIREGRLAFRPLSVEACAASQEANIRHRREELPFRLQIADHKAWWAGRDWRPRKRVAAGPIENEKRMRVQKARIRIREDLPLLWNHVKRTGDFGKFLRIANQEAARYQSAYDDPPRMTMRMRFGKIRREVFREVRMFRVRLRA